jgi:glycosyltransferase involved in cell wall biosynthesis
MKTGINLIGYFGKALGIGESARLFAEAIRRQGIPLSIISADALAPIHRDLGKRDQVQSGLEYSVNVFCLDSRHIFEMMALLGWSKIGCRHNVAICFWETNQIPKSHLLPWAQLDELWAPARFIEATLRAATRVPVTYIPQPLEIPSSSSLGALAHPRLTKAGFRFLVSFSFFSGADRKNPGAAIRAFKRAFAERDDVQLVIKSQGAASYPRQHRKLMLEFDDPRMIWIDEELSSNDRYALLKSCDCYVSLHRAEGFGLGLAEAMLLGKPVIATGFSGNLEFMNSGNSVLIPYRLVSIGRGHNPYPRLASWAEPDISEAAHWMQYLASHPEQAAEIGEQGRRDVSVRFSFDAVGRAIARWLTEIELPSTGRQAPRPYLRALPRLRVRRALRAVRGGWPSLRRRS